MNAVSARFTSAGAIAALDAGDLSLLLYPASELEAGPMQLWLRRRTGDAIVPHPLTGPASGSVAAAGAVSGTWRGLAYTAWWEPIGSGYRWLWEVRNTGPEPVAFDVVFTQDVALAPWEEVRRNEYYVSQYLDVTPIETGLGTAIGVRQNMPGSGHPWLGLVSLTGVSGWVTDAAQVRSPGGGLDLTRDLPAERWQHEHTLAGLQAPQVGLEPGESARGGFAGVFVPHHPAATSDRDAEVIAAFVAGTGSWPTAPEVSGNPAVETVFNPALPFGVRDGTESDAVRTAGGQLAHTEHGPDGAFWSAFAGARHLVGRAKEHAVLRPHGHVAHFGPQAAADGRSVASTAWFDGVFCSQLTRGHASAAPVVGLRRGYAGLTRAGGVRVAVREGGKWRLLGAPSLWVQDMLTCTWHYDGDGARVRVTSTLGPDGVRLRIETSPAREILVAVEASGAGPVPAGGEFGDDSPLFADGGSRGLPWRCSVSAQTNEVDVSIGFPGVPVAEPARAAHPWRVPRLVGDGSGVSEIDAVLPWYAHDAAVHFQAPRGLEQFTGGAWGSRDVCQGPVGLLLATGEHAALRTTLLNVFAGQQDDGDWPQWFDYLPEVAAPGHRESHGDVVYWPLLALGEYLQVTGDIGVLDEAVRFVGSREFGEPSPVLEHVARALDCLEPRRACGTALPAYGHGDWNDSLQPAHPELAERMCSAWTSVLEIEALRTLAAGLGDGVLADRANRIADSTESALMSVMLVDGELAGYGVAGDSGIELLVHPRDEVTGLHHGSLQVIHAISAELLSPEAAAGHLAVIDAHLASPHGLLLFDTPMAYSGGEMHVFKRAEAASFWGREIGLIYTHAHLRWVESLTHLGAGERAWAELLRVVPVGIQSRIPGARPRQASCYYSSEDALFPDRYVARDLAPSLFDPHLPFEGGWRVYSSGPGLILRLVTERLLGVRFRAVGVEIDPVLPPGMDGLQAAIATPDGGFAHFTYRIGSRGHGVEAVRVDGAEAESARLTARYRAGGVRVDRGQIRAGSRVEVVAG